MTTPLKAEDIDIQAFFKTFVALYQSDKTIDYQLDPITLPSIGDKGLSMAEVTQIWQQLVDHSTHLTSPKMLGHMDTAPHPIAALTDAVVAALNNNLLFRELSPLASRIETTLCQWLAQRLGLLEHEGLFCSGGSIANLSALFAACGGFQKTVPREKIHIVVSETAHISVIKAALILGIPKTNIVTIPADENGVMQVEVLAKQLVQSSQATIVVATLGTTLHGAIDPVAAIAKLKQQHDFWLHIDAVYGGALALSQGYRHFLTDIAAANSLTIAPHKWLYVPRVSAITYLKDKSLLAQTLNYSLMAGEPHLGQWGIQGSRRADAVTLWVTLLTLGLQQMTDNIDGRIALAAQCYQALLEDADFEPLHQPQLNLLLFKPKAAIDLNQLHQRLTQQQRHWVSLSSWRGEPVLRAVLLNPQTTLQHFQTLLSKLTIIMREMNER